MKKNNKRLENKNKDEKLTSRELENKFNKYSKENKVLLTILPFIIIFLIILGYSTVHQYQTNKQLKYINKEDQQQISKMMIPASHSLTKNQLNNIISIMSQLQSASKDYTVNKDKGKWQSNLSNIQNSISDLEGKDNNSIEYQNDLSKIYQFTFKIWNSNPDETQSALNNFKL